MTKIGIVFPGQGTQYVGMGKELYETFPEIRNYYDKSSEILGYDVKQLIFEGPQEKLAITNFTQVAVFVTSFICYQSLKLKFPEIEKFVSFVAGHSLGEYTAVCISGALSFEDTVKIVSLRGEIMQKESEKYPGGMVAVIGMDSSELTSLCKEISVNGLIVEPVNFNTLEQTVVSGNLEGIEKLVAILNEKKVKNIKLKVSGAFHSSLMNEAQKIFSIPLDKININNAFIRIVMNYDALAHTDKIEIRENLKLQINHPVRWVETVKYMISQGTEIFIECGPAKTLSNMIKKIDSKPKVFNVENLSSLQTTVENLKQIFS